MPTTRISGALSGCRGRVAVGTLAAVIGAASVTAVSAPRAASPDAPMVLRQVSVQFALEAHARLGRMAAMSATIARRAAVGEQVHGGLAAGTVSRPDICAVGTAGLEAVGTAGLDTAYVAWQVHATVRSANAERIELDLAWSRRNAVSGVTEEGARTIALGLGESHLVDLISVTPAESTTCSHVALRVTVGRYFPMSSELLVHRIWLVYEHGGDRWVSDPIEAIGSVGQPVPFRFRPLRWSVSGAMGASPTGIPSIDMDVLGTVNTEPFEDGRFETMLDAQLVTRFGPVAFRGRGTMQMAGHVGDAGEVELPAPGGLAQVVMDPLASGALAPGLSRKGDKLELRVQEFFAASRTSLVMTVERLRQASGG